MSSNDKDIPLEKRPAEVWNIAEMLQRIAKFPLTATYGDKELVLEGANHILRFNLVRDARAFSYMYNDTLYGTMPVDNCTIEEYFSIYGGIIHEMLEYMETPSERTSMNNICHTTFNWYEVGKETPREGILLFFVTADRPDIILSGVVKDGRFFIQGQDTIAYTYADTKVTHFAYQNVGMLPSHASNTVTDSGWHIASLESPEDDEPVAIWPSFRGHQFAVWNKHEQCWDDESGDDYLCDKEAVQKWFKINWGGAV